MQWAAKSSGGPGRESQAADKRILNFLDLRDNEGLSMGQIADATGATRSAVIGAISRIRKEPVPPCRCRRVENKDGGMARRWWKAGGK
jgi:hypothetical protein